ncbi:RND family efflux transporter, MFP subunit [Ferrimonas sediminum]|uniref:RND family efflux transporter, MFP subunit n=1 Tax=Ferrimonas sediminum TaxID=718193 RepID=A0A1G8NDZ8_9GAMM|nr:efflux RND transporter periplasmic adaptor subunit [Ferrimonas sediminum]SDI78316.1 RND family efflux transporter, MFP subunit [Ferrimonas sediminum]
MKPRILTLLCLLLTFIGCKPSPETTATVKVRPVKLVTLDNTALATTYQFPAVIDASKDADLSFQVSGLLQELNIMEAQQVKQGDVLAMLDQRDFINKLASAKAEYDNAEREYRRLEQVASKGLISQSELTKQRSARDIAKANLGIAEKALSDSVITAPFDGTIAQIPVTKLQNVTAGDLIAKMIDTYELEVKFDVPSRLIQDNTPPRIEVMLNADPSRRFEARFKELGLIADPNSQTYPVTMVITPPQDRLVLPGMLATVEVIPESADQASMVAIPMAAVQSQGDSTYVWLFNEASSTVSRRDIEVDDDIGEQIRVRQGLQMGDTIVGAGAAYLAEGMEVRPWQD